jgi:hypothetical protein
LLTGSRLAGAPRPHGRTNEKAIKATGEITRFDVAAVFFVSLLIPILELAETGKYWVRLEDWLDNESYVEIANVIRIIGGVPHHYQFWGLPNIIAAIQAAFEVSGFVVIMVVSVVCSAAASFLIDRLYGASVAIMFLIVCPVWVRLSVMGGTEPLFLCLLSGCWLAFRSNWALLAAVLASFATTVRPFGFSALCGIGFALILQRDWKRLAMSISIAAGVGLAYLVQCQVVSGDPLINFRLYSSHDWPGGYPLSLPFVQIGKGVFDFILPNPWTNWIEDLFSLTLVGVGTFFLSTKFATLLRRYPAELVFVSAYLIFLVCYNTEIVIPHFARYSIPVIPFLLFAAYNWLPTNRFVLWPLAIFSALIASSGLVGFETVFGFSLPLHR